jgi:hypothetical protein
MKKIDPIYEGLYAVETLAKGAFVKLSAKSTTVWTVGDYDRSFREYELHDYNDISRNKWVKKGKKLFAGFCY